MSMDCCFHNAPPSGCNQGRKCGLTEQEIDRAIANSQMPGAYTYGTPPQPPRLPTTSTGVVIGGRYSPRLSRDQADPIRYHKRRSAARRFFARLAAWLLS